MIAQLEATAKKYGFASFDDYNTVIDNIGMIMSGIVRFVVGGRETIVKAGELIQIPPNVAHEIEVLEDAVAIDVFSPVRQDWIDKTDTYFKR